MLVLRRILQPLQGTNERMGEVNRIVSAWNLLQESTSHQHNQDMKVCPHPSN